MNTGITFITNGKNESLLNRFNVLIRDTGFFDILVGYFYTSGFYVLYRSLENAQKNGSLSESARIRQWLTLFISLANINNRFFSFLTHRWHMNSMD